MWRNCFPMLMSLAILGFAGCHLERVNIAGDNSPVTWSVEPALFCPGERVVVTWDMSNMPLSEENCQPPNGGFERKTTCMSNLECPQATDGSAPVCLDGFCCSETVFSRSAPTCPRAQGCYPTFGATLTANDEDLDPPIRGENDTVRQTREFMLDQTTEFKFSGFYLAPPSTFEDTKIAQFINPDVSNSISIDFPFLCIGNTPLYPTRSLETITTSEHVRIVGIRNASEHRIELTSVRPDVGPVSLSPGEMTEALNGRPRGLLSIRLGRFDPAGLVRPRCVETHIENPWPHLRIEIFLACSVE